MSAENDYISSESENTLQSVEMLQELLDKGMLTKYEVIALGKLLQDVYTGVERILRTVLEQKGVAIKKTETWHKELLLAAREQSIVSPMQFDAFRNLLLFRHIQVHGYGFMLDEKRLRQLAEPLPALCRGFLEDIRGK
jgi:uncharacterized protein YutE (UPF0331/DUF86 family)